MNKHDIHSDVDMSSVTEDELDWLKDALSHTLPSRGTFTEADLEDPPTENFMQKAHAAVHAAWIVAKLRLQREYEVSRRANAMDLIEPISLGTYLESLRAGAAIQSLVPLCEWLSLQDFSGNDKGSGFILGGLARDIGIGLDEALIRLRIGFQEEMTQAISNPIPVIASSAVPVSTTHRATKRCVLRVCDDQLKEKERSMDVTWLWRLRSIETEVRMGYRETKDDE